jgi:hypothetical protein
MEKRTSTLNDTKVLPVSEGLDQHANVLVESYERAARIKLVAEGLKINFSSFRFTDEGQALNFALAQLNSSKKTMIDAHTSPEQRGAKIAEIFNHTIRPAIESDRVGIMVQAPEITQLVELWVRVNDPTFDPAIVSQAAAQA